MEILALVMSAAISVWWRIEMRRIPNEPPSKELITEDDAAYVKWTLVGWMVATLILLIITASAYMNWIPLPYPWVILLMPWFFFFQALAFILIKRRLAKRCPAATQNLDHGPHATSV